MFYVLVPVELVGITYNSSHPATRRRYVLTRDWSVIFRIGKLMLANKKPYWNMHYNAFYMHLVACADTRSLGLSCRLLK